MGADHAAFTSVIAILCLDTDRPCRIEGRDQPVSSPPQKARFLMGKNFSALKEAYIPIEAWWQHFTARPHVGARSIGGFVAFKPFPSCV